MTYHWYTVGHNTIEVGDMTEIFYVDWDWVLFWRFFHKLEPPFPQNEMLLISKEIRMSPTVFIKSLLEANDCNFLAFEIYKHFNMLMNYNTVI